MYNGFNVHCESQFVIVLFGVFKPLQSNRNLHYPFSVKRPRLDGIIRANATKNLNWKLTETFFFAYFSYAIGLNFLVKMFGSTRYHEDSHAFVRDIYFGLNEAAYIAVLICKHSPLTASGIYTM